MHEDTLANQKLEEKWKWQITRNGSTTTTTTVEPYVWTDNDGESLQNFTLEIKMNKMQKVSYQ